MPRRQLRASVRRVGLIPIVDLQGDIDAPGELVLKTAYENAASEPTPAIVLNFTRAGFVNSKGIALIVGLLSQARRSGLELLAYGLGNHYRRIMDITQLSTYIGVYEDETGALAAAHATNPAPSRRQN